MREAGERREDEVGVRVVTGADRPKGGREGKGGGEERGRRGGGMRVVKGVDWTGSSLVKGFTRKQ